MREELNNGGYRPAAVLGVGLTGASWAALFAAHGRDVRIYDRDSQQLAKGMEYAQKCMRYLYSEGIVDHTQVAGEITPCSQLSECVRDVVFIQEAVFEDYGVKREIFRAADTYAPREAVIATSSSGLSISRIQKAARYADRCIAGHPYNPPHLVPLVEIAPGEDTSTASIETARRFYKSVGKQPVVLNREVPGYLANRMSAALWREAINLVIGGVASVEDVDRAITLGPGLR